MPAKKSLSRVLEEVVDSIQTCISRLDDSDGGKESKKAAKAKPEPEKVEEEGVPSTEEIEKMTRKELDFHAQSFDLDTTDITDVDLAFALDHCFSAAVSGEVEAEGDDNDFLCSIMNVGDIKAFVARAQELFGGGVEEGEVEGEDEGEEGWEPADAYEEAALAFVNSEIEKKDGGPDWAGGKKVVSDFIESAPKEVVVELLGIEPDEFMALEVDEGVKPFLVAVLAQYTDDAGEVYDTGEPFQRGEDWWADGGPIEGVDETSSTGYSLVDAKGAGEAGVTQEKVDEAISGDADIGQSYRSVYIMLDEGPVEVEPKKKKRGRAKKETAPEETPPVKKRGRGRPKKAAAKASPKVTRRRGRSKS